MKKNLAIALSAIMLMGVFSGCSGASENPGDSGGAGTTPVTIQLGHVNPTNEDDGYQYFAARFAELVNERTDGRYVIEVHGNGELGGERDMMEGMQIGTIDMAVITNMNFNSILPEAQILDLPFTFDSYEKAWKVVDGKIGETIAERLYEKCNIKLLGWGENGFRHTINNVRPITRLKDYSGLKIRVPESAIYIDTYNALGANATPIAFSETISGLQQGTIDGYEVPISAVNSAGTYEFMKYMSLDYHVYCATSICMSGTMFDGLSDEDKEIFQAAAKEAGQEEREFLVEQEGTLKDTMTADSNMVINEVKDLSELKEAAMPVWDSYRSVIGDELIDELIEETSK